MLNATFLVIFKHCAIVKKCYELKKNSRQIISLKLKQKQKLERWLVSLKFARKNINFVVTEILFILFNNNIQTFVILIRS